MTVSVKEPKRDFDSNVLRHVQHPPARRRRRARTVFALDRRRALRRGAPIPTDESYVAQPLSPYGASKQAAEAFVGALARFHGIDHAVLRLGNVHGPRQNPHGEAGVVAIFSERLLLRRPVVVLLRPRHSDARLRPRQRHRARAFVTLADTPGSGTFNLGWGRRCPFSRCWTASAGSRDVGRAAAQGHFGRARLHPRRDWRLRTPPKEPSGWRRRSSLKTASRTLSAGTPTPTGVGADRPPLYPPERGARSPAREHRWRCGRLCGAPARLCTAPLAHRGRGRRRSRRRSAPELLAGSPPAGVGRRSSRCGSSSPGCSSTAPSPGAGSPRSSSAA